MFNSMHVHERNHYYPSCKCYTVLKQHIWNKKREKRTKDSYMEDSEHDTLSKTITRVRRRLQQEKKPFFK